LEAQGLSVTAPGEGRGRRWAIYVHHCELLSQSSQGKGLVLDLI